MALCCAREPGILKYLENVEMPEYFQSGDQVRCINFQRVS